MHCVQSSKFELDNVQYGPYRGSVLLTYKARVRD